MEQRTEEWFEARKGRVTASMAGAILGIAPYMTSADAMRAMVREALGAEREFTGNVATEYGTFHESGALVEFQMETGLSVKPAPFVAYEDWLGASPDGYVSDGGLVEVKCPYGLRGALSPAFKTAAEQPHYYAQMQVQLHVTHATHCWFWQWASADTRIERVEYDRAWIAENLPKLAQFYAEYLDELQNNADDHLAPKRIEIDTPQAHKMIAEWDQLNETLERAAERKKDLLEDMVALAGEKNALFAGRKLTLTERAGTVAYAKAIKALLPNADLKQWRGKPTQFWGVR